MMLLAQMVMPGVMAQDATPDAVPSFETTVPAPPEDLGDILTPEETEEAVPVESDADLVAPETVESEGGDPESPEPDSQKDEQGPVADPNPDVDVQSSSAPVTETRISTMSVVGPGVTGVTVTPTILADVCDKVRMDVTWSVDDSARSGDTFTFTLDSRLNVPNTVIPLPAPDGQSIVANLRLVGGVATVTLTDYVNNHNNVRGTAWFESSSCWAESYQGQTVNLTFSGQQEFVIPVTVPVGPTPAPTQTPAPGTNPEKSGRFTRPDQGRTDKNQAIEWTVRAPSGPSGGVTLTDTAGANWIFECSTLTWLDGIQPTSFNCDANGVTATFGAYESQWWPRPGFTIKATITGDIPADPSNLLTFSNTANAQAKDWAGNPVNPGQATTNLGQSAPTPTPDPNVTPAPTATPTPAVNPVKYGSFTDSLDQGKTEPENALRWTVTAPPGPAGGITITDTAGANWKFECDTITYQNGIQPLDVQCSEQALVVKFGPYASAENPWWPRPGFSIEASITSPPSVNNKTFTNTVTTVVNGWEGEGEFFGEGSRTSTFQQTSSGGGGGIGDDQRRPVTPAIVGNVCEDGQYTPPTITVNDPDSGLTYAVGDVDPVTGEYTVTAALGQGQTWADLSGTGWVVNPQNPSEAIFAGTVDLVSCEPEEEPELVVPIAPAVTGNVCEAGEYSEPALELATSPDGVTYEVTHAIDENGDYVVTATLDDGFAWDNLEGTGWTVNPNNESEATYSGHVDLVPCEPEPEAVVPVAPDVTGNVCVDGVYSAPAIVLAEAPDGVSYAIVQEVDGNGAYVVSASLTDGYTWGELEGTGWRINPENAAEATYSGTVELRPCVPVVPVAPTVTGNVCVDGAYTEPELVLATTPDGIAYTVVQEIDDNGEYTVTATLNDGYTWGELVEGWERSSDTVATYTGSVVLTPCDIVIPIAPTVNGNVCVGGEYAEPELELSEAPDGVTYDVEQAIDEHGAYIVTATLGDGQAWPAQLPEGWERTSDTVATYTGFSQLQPCDTVLPVSPAITGNVCDGGVYTEPSIVLAETPEGVSYEVSLHIDEDGRYIVTATLTDGLAWADLDGTGWELLSATVATYNGMVELAPCEPVLPVAPVVTGNVCAGGSYTDPSIVTSTTTGVIYEIVQNVNEEGSYVVTATVTSGFGWGEMTEGWERTSDSVATYRGQVDLAPCDPVIPVAPMVTGNVCAGGVYVEPVVIPGTTPEGITYAVLQDIDANGDYVVTATLAQGQAWGELQTGWERISDTMAVFSGHVDLAPCVDAIPVLPNVEQAVCTDGALLPPVLTSAQTDGVDYEFTGGIAPGSTVVVTATLVDGYAWPAELPEGWTKVNDTTATALITLDDVECETVIPAAPVVFDAVCDFGIVTDPTITLQETDGVRYDVVGDIVPGEVVEVIATLDDGYAWGEMPEGWTRVDSTTASWQVTFDDPDCIVATPVAPSITQAVCAGGDIVGPRVMPGTTEGVLYTFNEEDVTNGGTVIVTATVQTGYAWPAEMPQGWTKVSDTTATYNVMLDEVACAPVAPVLPQVMGMVCLDGVTTGPEIVVNDPESGLVYVIGEVDSETGEYIVQAMLGDGQAWGEMPAGWTIDSSTLATYRGQLDLAPCTTIVPENPTVVPAVCVEGEVTKPVVTLPETSGVTYTIDGDIVAGGTVVVQATLDDGYSWGDMPEGWTPVSTTTAIFSIVLETTTCKVPDAPTTPETPETPGIPETTDVPVDGKTPSSPSASPESGTSTGGHVEVTDLPSAGTGTGVGTMNAMAVAVLAGTLAVTAAGLRLRFRMVGR